jgi:hypothetical protein
MSPSLVIAAILYGGVVGSIGGIVVLLIYMLIESRKSKGGEQR